MCESGYLLFAWYNTIQCFLTLKKILLLFFSGTVVNMDNFPQWAETLRNSTNIFTFRPCHIYKLISSMVSSRDALNQYVKYQKQIVKSYKKP